MLKSNVPMHSSVPKPNVRNGFDKTKIQEFFEKTKEAANSLSKTADNSS